MYCHIVTIHSNLIYADADDQTWSSCMAHCLPPMGLCQRQKNQGEEEEQERVRGEPSLVIVPNLGNLDTISIPLASSPLNRRRGRRRGNENIMFLTRRCPGTH